MRRELGSVAAQVGVLGDELRNAMYQFIRKAGRPVSREDAAAEVGISRKLAAFHLDKLVETGLLRAHYARLPGRSGPGAGRSSKLYEPSEVEIEISIPSRRYDLVGRILVDAMENARPDESPREAARRVAAGFGSRLGAEFRRETGLRPPGPERTLTVAEQILARHGYEPYRKGHGEVALRNCPFHHLARDAPDLVCGLNRAFIHGILRGLGSTGVEAALEPQPGQCCVILRAG